MRIRSLFLAVALAGGLLSPTAAPAQEAAEAVHSDNMRHVANVAYPDANRAATRGSTPDHQGGTDLEFTTLTLPVRQAARELGNPRRHDLDGSLRNGVQREYAISGTYENGLQIVDVSDPAEPSLVTTYPCDVLQGDVQIFTRDDLGGRTFITYAVDSGIDDPTPCAEDAGLPDGGVDFVGTLMIEITDPYRPRSVGFAPIDSGTHNMTVAPGGRYMYNSDNNTAAQLEVWSIEDPTAPTHVSTLPLTEASSDAHDITFNADGTRAYVASITHSYIIDTTDLANPTTVSVIADPAVTIHHQADPVTVDGPLGERTYLVINDETAGAAGNGFCPGGGLHIWDITTEVAPVKVGAFFMNEATVQEGSPTGAAGLVTCTSHVFRAYPEHGVLTIAWFSGGVRVLDLSSLAGVSAGVTPELSSPVGMQELGYYRFADSDAWAAKIFHADEDGTLYIGANDQTRGFDVFAYTPGATAPAAGDDARGEWVSPQEALARAEQLRAQPGYVRPLQPFCTLPTA